MNDKNDDIKKTMNYIINCGLKAIASDKSCKKNTKLLKSIMKGYFRGKTLKEICDKKHIDFYKVTGWMVSSKVYHGIYPLPGQFKHSHVKYMWLNNDNPRSKYYHIMPQKLVDHINQYGIHKNDGYITRALWCSQH